MSLFRKEAVSHQSERLTGAITLAQPLSPQKASDQIQHLPMTRIMIAHRQETINMAEQVYHLENGILFNLSSEHYKTVS